MVNCEGWTCPTCRRNYAPWMPSCNCINSAVGVNTASMTITPHADDTAELIAALEAVTKAAYDPGAGEYAMTVATMRRVQAALARVKEQHNEHPVVAAARAALRKADASIPPTVES